MAEDIKARGGHGGQAGDAHRRGAGENGIKQAEATGVLNKGQLQENGAQGNQQKKGKKDGKV